VWHAGDRIDIGFPAEVELTRWLNNAVSVSRGALVYALPVRAAPVQFADFGGFAAMEFMPASEWNFGLVLQGSLGDGIMVYEKAPLPDPPWNKELAPCLLRTPVVPVPEWKLEKNNASLPPVGPVQVSARPQTVTLVPYGSTILRIAVFPEVTLN
jgi:hypothetical protein